MLPENQHHVVVDTRTGRTVEELTFIFFPERDPHALRALEGYARSMARTNISNARRIQAICKSLGHAFELFPGGGQIPPVQL